MKEINLEHDMGRLRDLPTDDDPTGVGILIRSVALVEQTTPAARQLVKWRIRKTLREGERGLLLILRPALMVAIVFASGGMLGAAIQKLVAHASAPRRPAPGGVPEVLKVSGKTLPRPMVGVTTPARSVTMSAVESGSGADPKSEGGAWNAAVRRAVVSRPGRSPREAGPAGGRIAGPSTTLVDPAPHFETTERAVEEHTLLAGVIRRLRVEGKAMDALTELGDYNARFPQGVLAPEAAALTAETLLKLGRKAEAIHALNELLARPLPGNDERRVLRGELLASLGSWRDAAADFDKTLVSTEDNANSRPRAFLVERALWGRAVARNRLGEDPGARSDLTEYLRRFPNGAFAIQAARALDRKP